MARPNNAFRTSLRIWLIPFSVLAGATMLLSADRSYSKPAGSLRATPSRELLFHPTRPRPRTR